MLKRITIGDIIIWTMIIAVVASVIFGFAKGDWAPFSCMILMILFILILYFLYGLAEDRLEKYLPLRPKVLSPSDGNVDVEILCTRHLMGNGPIYIHLNGENIGKTYRGRSVRVSLREGPNRISAYRNEKEMVIEEGIIEDGSSLMIWSDNGMPPKYRLTFLKKGEKFDEEALIESYEKFRSAINGSACLMILMSIAAFVVVWGYL